MTKREWIKAILSGEKDLPIAQQWMSFFNGDTARKLTPESCHYQPMWLYDVGHTYNMAAMGHDALDKMIEFNNYTGRCMSCLGNGANISWGHGGPGEFFAKVNGRSENTLLIEYETGVLAKVQLKPHFYHTYNHPVGKPNDLINLNLPDPSDPVRYEGFAQDAAYLRSKGEYVVGSLNGFFSGIHYFIMDYEQILMALVLEHDFVQAILEILGNWNITAACKMIEAGADCIALCDDLGSKMSLLMSPEQYRKFFKPWHKKLCQAAHNLGAQVHLHSHGAIAPILDDLVDCGFDFINPFDPEEGFDLEQTLKSYSEKFVIVGGFPASFWEWKFERQNQYIHDIASLGQKYGRFIFMDSGGIPENITPQVFNRVLGISRKARRIDHFSNTASFV